MFSLNSTKHLLELSKTIRGEDMNAAAGAVAVTLTRDAWKKFAPGCPPAWTEALFGNLDLLTDHGLLETELRWCHFAGTVYAETGNFKYLRESLYYTTIGALRRAWPSRFNPLSTAQCKAFLKNPRGLANKVYNGRMGNRPGSSDGYDFRGGGWIQTTGRSAVEEYCKQLGITAGPSTLDDPLITLQFAVLEWTNKNCNKWADQNEIVKIAKAINTGSADSDVTPNGMNNRREGFARAWAQWGEYDADAAKVATKPTSKKMTTAIATGAATTVSLLSSTVPTDPLGTAEKAVQTGQRVQAITEQSGGLLSWSSTLWHSAGISLSVVAAAALCGGVYWVFTQWLPSNYGSKA